jgi:ATP-binding cassette, subfamily B, bacterial MsbA
VSPAPDQTAKQDGDLLPLLGINEAQRSVSERFARDWLLPRWRQIAVSLAIAVGLGLTTAGYARVMKFAFDTLGQGKFEALLMVLFSIVGITALRGLFMYLHQIRSNAIVARLQTDMQVKCFAHLLDSDYARFASSSTGQLVARMTHDIGIMTGASQMVLNTLIRDVVGALALVATMLYFDWMLSLIVIFVYPFTALPIILISRRLRKVARKSQAEVGDMMAGLTEKLAGARLIKTFRLEAYAAGKLNQHFEQIHDLRMKAVSVRARLSPMLEAFAGLAIAGVIGLASWRITTGISSTGDFMGFVTALLLAANSLRSLGSFSTNLQDGVAATERLYEMLDRKPLVVDRATAKPLVVTSATIAFDAVSFAYENRTDVQAIRSFSLTIPGGKTAALVGRSGAGKSTMINLVPRLFDVTAGAIRIDGQDVRDVTLASLRDTIAIVSQEVTLFDDTIRANIRLGRLDATDADIIAAAKDAAAHDFIMAQANGYDTRIGDGGMRLSGGQRQRLALARAILRNAPILLLDEATSALDTESERLVQAALQRFTHNRTTLIIAHRLSTVQRADMICVIDDGRLVEQGSHAALLAKDGQYAALCRSQLLQDGAPPSPLVN